MTTYRLKKGIEAFEVVDGPYAGRQYKPGVDYADIPPQEAKKFAKLKADGGKPDAGKPKTKSAESA